MTTQCAPGDGRLGAQLGVTAVLHTWSRGLFWLRLADAREAVDRFAERVSALERERADTTDPTQRAALDEALAVLRRRLRMTEIAERGVAAELASRP